MTATTMTNLTKKFFIGALATMMVLFFYACAKKTVAASKTETTAAPGIPENKGQVQIKRDANSNYVIQINLRELEAAAKFEPETKKSYIVWMNADNQEAKNLGQINSNSGWLTDKSKASFEAVSEFKPTKIFITEEDMAAVKTPGTKLIWSTNSF